MTSNQGRNAYGVGVAVALGVALLQVWMNLAVGIVGNEDNPVNQGFYGVVAAALACAFTARFTPDGMARAMLATAGVQALLALAIATAPSTARIQPDEPIKVLVLSGGFVTLWLISAAFFHRSARLGLADGAAA